MPKLLQQVNVLIFFQNNKKVWREQTGRWELVFPLLPGLWILEAGGQIPFTEDPIRLLFYHQSYL